MPSATTAGGKGEHGTRSHVQSRTPFCVCQQILISVAWYLQTAQARHPPGVEIRHPVNFVFGGELLFAVPATPQLAAWCNECGLSC